MKILVLLLFALGLTQADENVTATEKSVNYQKNRKESIQKQITDALTQWIEDWSDTKVKLSVNYISYKEGWAWVETIPHYTDGKKHEAKIDALMRKKEYKWVVMYVANNDDGLSRKERPEKDRSLQRFLKKPYGSAPLYLFDHNKKEIGK